MDELSIELPHVETAFVAIGNGCVGFRNMVAWACCFGSFAWARSAVAWVTKERHAHEMIIPVDEVA
jgi:hypothetical protein